jgi:hypothetical protein
MKGYQVSFITEMMAMTEEKAGALFARVNATDTRLFYIKTAIEYGEIGAQADGSAKLR